MTDRPSSSLPFVTDGKGSGIIEDCGGIGGLKAVMEAFKIKAGEDYENYKDWLGRDDIDLTTGILQNALEHLGELFNHKVRHKSARIMPAMNKMLEC